jgi:hypothetical protein
MNCLYCEVEARLSNETQVNNSRKKMFVCTQCDAYYFVDKENNNLTSYNVPIKINNEQLILYFNKDQTFMIEGYFVQETILTLPYWPKLTAQNMRSKVKTWIIFS